MSIIFPNEIFLNENKRLNNEADKNKLTKLKEDLFDEDKDVKQILKENFKFTNKITTTNNVSYRNNIAEEVSSNIRKQQNRTAEYEVGEELLCKEFYKVSGYRKLKDATAEKVGITNATRTAVSKLPKKVARPPPSKPCNITSLRQIAWTTTMMSKSSKPKVIM